jgi:hypothetical protein
MEGGEIDTEESSYYEPSISEKDSLDNELINTLDPKNFNINDLNKNPKFNKLSNEQKTLVINNILEKMPKLTKTKSNENPTYKKSYFYCKSCGHNEVIPDKMMIFSKGNENKEDIDNLKYNNYKYDNTLPFTKKYNCINDNCSTHKEPNLKMAVFYRKKNSYNIKYICSVCNSYWNTFTEK